jgi:group I intron endonuclease
MKKRSGVYLIESLVDGKCYVGSSINPHRRWNEHRRELESGRHCNKHLQKAWDKYGAVSFRHVMLEYCEVDALPEREGWWIVLLGTANKKRGFNQGGCVRGVISDELRERRRAVMMGKRILPEGYTHSESTRAKMSATHKKMPIPAHLIQKGDTVPPERRAQMSAISKRRPLPEGMMQRGGVHALETRAKMSAAGKGRKLSEAECQRRSETRRKQIAPFTGKTHSEETKAKMAVARMAYYERLRFLAAHD